MDLGIRVSVDDRDLVLIGDEIRLVARMFACCWRPVIHDRWVLDRDSGLGLEI
jgi:hypothetical protein